MLSRVINDFLYVYIPCPALFTTLEEDESLYKYYIENMVRLEIEKYRQVRQTDKYYCILLFNTNLSFGSSTMLMKLHPWNLMKGSGVHGFFDRSKG